jgi:hypothetical protein
MKHLLKEIFTSMVVLGHNKTDTIRIDIRQEERPMSREALDEFGFESMTSKDWMDLLAMRIVGEISRGGDLVSNLVDALSGDCLNQFRYFRRMPQSQSTFGSEVSLETAPEGWCG